MTKVNISGVPVELVSNETIWESGCVIMAVPVADMLPLEMYVPGTRGGFACHLCGQECILAPSGQTIIAAGKNPVQCIPCSIRLLEEAKAGKGDN